MFGAQGLEFRAVFGYCEMITVNPKRPEICIKRTLGEDGGGNI